MHTSTRLQSTDFQFWQHTHEGPAKLDFANFCPNYHEQDRVGVVSLCLEDGILHTASALLALTTAFYDVLRTRTIPFFDYPQHFALVGATAEGVQTGQGSLPVATPNLWDSWSWLDVWPDCKWITAPPTATAMVKSVFDFQINRLFWPRHLTPTPEEPPVPDYVY